MRSVGSEVCGVNKSAVNSKYTRPRLRRRHRNSLPDLPQRGTKRIHAQSSSIQIRAACHARTHRIIRIVRQQRIPRRVCNCVLRNVSALRRHSVRNDAKRVAPHHKTRLARRAGPKGWIERPAQRPSVAGRVPAAIKRKIPPVVYLGALAPPEKPLHIGHHAQLIRQFDLAEQIIHAHSAQQDRVCKIHRAATS